MKDEHLVHNLFWKSLSEFENYDPQLSRIKKLPYIYSPPIVNQIPILTPGIYILTGGRQVGKSTALKLMIKNLIKSKKMLPRQIYYLPCDTITNFEDLLFEIDQFRASASGEFFSLFIDEISFVKEWHRAIKSLADSGFVDTGSILITGSDTYLLKDAMASFPGRRGKASTQDFHLSPLSFFEYVKLKKPKLGRKLGLSPSKNILDANRPEFKANLLNDLLEIFNEFLITGGYLSAINDYAVNNSISDATYKTYAQWIVGDMLKRGKDEKYLREIIFALFPRLLKQVSWHSFIENSSIEHHQTINDYFSILGRMDVAIILQALREDKFRFAPKKAKKVCFSDPFIFHSLHGWISTHRPIFSLAKDLLAGSSELKNALIEGTISALFSRKFNTGYIKAEGEVDLALLYEKSFLPIEIKNSAVLRKNELKQILKYKHGLIGYSGLQIGKFEHLEVVPIPLLAYLAG